MRRTSTAHMHTSMARKTRTSGSTLPAPRRWCRTSQVVFPPSIRSMKARSQKTRRTAVRVWTRFKKAVRRCFPVSPAASLSRFTTVFPILRTHLTCTSPQPWRSRRAVSRLQRSWRPSYIFCARKTSPPSFLRPAAAMPPRASWRVRPARACTSSISAWASATIFPQCSTI